MSDIYLNIDNFNNLFKILKSKNSYIDNTNTRIEIAQKMTTQLNDYINYLKSSSLTNKDCINETTQISSTLSSMLTNLNSIRNSLEKIEKKILELIMKKEDLSYSDNDLNEDITKVKNEIADFEKLSEDLDSTILNDYEIVKEYFKKTPSLDIENNTDDIFKNVNKFSSNPESTIDNTVSISDTSLFENIDISEIQDNFVLRISEKDNKVYLPYSKEEVLKYLKAYPDVFKDANAVIKREFITELSLYTKHSFLARFREVYSLIRNREMKSFPDALKRAVDLMFRAELNPAIVAGLKSESQLDQLLKCIETNTLDDFEPFKIIFEINPAKRYH